MDIETCSKIITNWYNMMPSFGYGINKLINGELSSPVSGEELYSNTPLQKKKNFYDHQNITV